jgi:hypothetical protein
LSHEDRFEATVRRVFGVLLISSALYAVAGVTEFTLVVGPFGQTIHERMRLSRRTLTAGHVVQTNATKANGQPTSPNTLWRDYPPFSLARTYSIEWQHVANDPLAFTALPQERREYPSFKLLLVSISAEDAGRSA